MKKTWIATTDHEKWTEKIVSEHQASENSIEVTGLKQEIDGFGACFNELGYKALNKLAKEDKDKVFDELFGVSEANFTYCRVPIGANDFAESWYSLNETDDDFEMQHFSIERDKKGIVSFIKEAQERTKNLTLFASPWSPPTWMKYPKVYNFGTLIWEEKYLKAYALYFQRFIEEYRKEEIKIDKVFVQNEVTADQKFPSCLWSGAELRDFIKGYLGPQFERNNIDAEIWLGTINGPFMNYEFKDWFQNNFNQYAHTVLKDKEARKYIKGIGYQWGGKHALQQTNKSYPELKIAQTESECGDGNNTFASAEYVFNLMWTYFINGANSYTYWNIALEAESISTWGWKQNSLVVVDAREKAFKYNPEYYLMKHFSKYIKTGAKFAELKGMWTANTIAFQNTDGSRVYVILNPFDEKEEITIKDINEEVTIHMEGHSINTIVLE